MKLPQISGLEVIKIFSKFGFITTKQRGSHVRLEKKTNEEIIKITFPVHPQLKKETLLSIIKSSKVNEKKKVLRKNYKQKFKTLLSHLFL